MQTPRRLVLFFVLVACIAGVYTQASESIRKVSEESFNALDYDGNDVISRSEFVGTFMKLQKLEAETSKNEKALSDAKDMGTRLKQRFERMDADTNGSVSQEEFVGASEQAGSNATDQASVFSKLDQDQDGAMSFDEYGTAMKRRLSGRLAASDTEKTNATADLKARISARFDYMDTDRDSVLTKEEYLSSARQREGTGQESATSFFAIADADNNNAISQEEFMSAMKRRLQSRFAEIEGLEDKAESRKATADLLRGLEIRFERMDSNDDNQVTQAEMDASRRPASE